MYGIGLSFYLYVVGRCTFEKPLRPVTRTGPPTTPVKPPLSTFSSKLDPLVIVLPPPPFFSSFFFLFYVSRCFRLGRCLYGVGLGLSLRCGPMYLRETVTASFKDRATVSVKLSMVCGMIVSYIIGGILDNTLWGE